jgi:hypothetical protein
MMLEYGGTLTIFLTCSSLRGCRVRTRINFKMAHKVLLTFQTFVNSKFLRGKNIRFEFTVAGNLQLAVRYFQILFVTSVHTAIELLVFLYL